MGLQRYGRAVAAYLILMLGGAAGAAAQSDLDPDEGFGNLPRVGLGYVVNAPNIFTGVALYGVADILGGLGLYVDAKFTLQTPADESDFFSDLTITEVEATGGQTFHGNGFGWWSVNGAVVRPISPELMLYLGAGYTQEDVYRRYNDELDILGLDTLGWYWVRDEQVSGGRVNLLGGAFFRMTDHVSLQFGGETAPGGATVGFSYSFPLR